MIDRSHDLSIMLPARELGISRGAVSCRPRQVADVELALMRRIDERQLELPFAGRRMRRALLAASLAEIGSKASWPLLAASSPASTSRKCC